jgi:NADPH-dependent 2,4-dienoyl-CoA reductase/sulfur reductase-like enzyme
MVYYINHSDLMRKRRRRDMKVIVVGCTHAGTTAVVKMKELYPDVEVTVYEKNDNISFLSCGIALYIADVVKDAAGLFYNSPENLAKLGVETNMEHEVVDIDPVKKEVEVRNLKTGEVFKDQYDKLLASVGSWPIDPPIPGRDLDNVVLCKNYDHAKEIIKRSEDIKNAVVVGAGYIGVELAEAFEMNGKKTTLIDAETRILPKYLDEEFTSKAEKAFTDHGVKLALGEMVKSFEGSDKVEKVVTDKGEYPADLVVMCIGFRPNTALLKDKVEMLGNGAIVVDDYMKTSNPDIFAAGDSAAIVYNPTGEKRYIPLATNAIRMGTLVGMNIKEDKVRYLGTQGTSGIKIYEHCIASSGLTEKGAEMAGKEVETVVLTEPYRPEFMPTYEDVTLKLVYEKASRRLLGGQIHSTVDLTMVANTLSICIQKEVTVDELAFMDFFFQPHFGKPFNFVNSAAQLSLKSETSEIAKLIAQAIIKETSKE